MNEQQNQEPIERSNWCCNLIKKATTATAYIDYAPAVGQVVKILQAVGEHNDGSARVCVFSIIDSFSGNDMYTENGTSRASGVRHALYKNGEVDIPEAIILHYGHTLRFNVLSATGGTNCQCNLWVEMLKGEDTYGE